MNSSAHEFEAWDKNGLTRLYHGFPNYTPLHNPLGYPLNLKGTMGGSMEGASWVTHGKDHMNKSILHSGSKAPNERGSKNHDCYDLHVYVVSGAPSLTSPVALQTKLKPPTSHRRTAASDFLPSCCKGFKNYQYYGPILPATISDSLKLIFFEPVLGPRLPTGNGPQNDIGHRLRLSGVRPSCRRRPYYFFRGSRLLMP